MSNDHFEFDFEGGVIRLKQKDSAALLLAILTAGKFGEYLDEKLLLNRILADLISQLNKNAASKTSLDPRPRFPKDFLFLVGKKIASQGRHIGFWGMSRQQQTEFIRSVVAAPHSFTDEEIDDIFDAIEAEVFHASELVAAVQKDNS